jgi:hypothetical protein
VEEGSAEGEAAIAVRQPEEALELRELAGSRSNQLEATHLLATRQLLLLLVLEDNAVAEVKRWQWEGE